MTHELGPLPYPAAEAAMNLCADHQGPVEAVQFLPEDTQLFTADQMRAYALAEVARAVAAEWKQEAVVRRAMMLAALMPHNQDRPVRELRNAARALFGDAAVDAVIGDSAQAHGQTP